VTSASRMLFGFARDGGVPGSGWLRRVDARTGTPVNATAACASAAIVLVAATARLSAAVFLAIAALATIALYASYGVPIMLGAVARRRGRCWTQLGRWTLGRAGAGMAWAAVVWTVFVEFVCCLVNRLAAAGFVVLVVAMVLLWVLRVRHRFRGPRVGLHDFERRDLATARPGAAPLASKAPPAAES
jgi:amino acid transporter